MKPKINSGLPDSAIITLMLYYVLIGIWIGKNTNLLETIIAGICILRIFYLILQKKNFSKYIKKILFTLMIMCYFLTNYILTNEKYYFFENMIYIIKVWSIWIYFSIILDLKINSFKIFMINVSKILNIYMVLNIVIMLLQLNESYFLIDKSRIPNTAYYPDYIAGLFGINGTHRFTIFCLLFLCLNIYLYKYKLVKQYNGIPKFLVITSACICFLSTQNDNNTFFIIYPIFFGVIYCISYKINIARILKIFSVFIVVCIILVLVIINNKTFFEEIGSRLNDIIAVYIFHDITTWDERAEFLTYVFRNGNGWLFGKGFGSVKMYSDMRISIHWGMNSLMTFVYFMGIVPLLFYVAVLVRVITDKLSLIKQKKRIIFQITLFIIMIMLTQYCQILSEMNLAILFALTSSIFVFSLVNKEL